MTKQLTKKERDAYLASFNKVWGNKFSVANIPGLFISWGLVAGVLLTLAVWVKWGWTTLFL